MSFQLGSKHICELGDLIAEQLFKNGLTNYFELTLHVNQEQFKKIDEDFFYRNRKDKKEEFIPSDKQIIIKLNSGMINIIKEE